MNPRDDEPGWSIHCAEPHGDRSERPVRLGLPRRVARRAAVTLCRANPGPVYVVRDAGGKVYEACQGWPPSGGAR